MITEDPDEVNPLDNIEDKFYRWSVPAWWPHVDPRQPTLFIADPTQGDQFVFGEIEKLKRFPIPKTADGHEISTAEDFMVNGDLMIYDEWDCVPTVTMV